MKENKFIIITFLSILFGILLLYPINFVLVKTGKLHIINSSQKEAISKEKGLLVDISNSIEKAKTSIDNKVINYFPFYSSLNKLDKESNSFFNRQIYSLLDKNYYPVGTNSDNEYIFRNDEHYFLQSKLSTKELDRRIEDQINFFNDLDIGKINIFIPYRFEYTNIDTSVLLRDMSSYIEKFKNSVEDNINIGEFMLDNMEDYSKYFYKTDHHYNMYGAYESYKIIMDMLNKNPKDAKVIEHDIKYYGSMARSSYQDDISDKFYTLDIDLGEYSVLVNDGNKEKYKPKKLLTSKPNSKFYDYYVNYYNGLFGNVVYDFKDDSKDNLLILEDSFGWQIDDLIASHYNKTYVIDIRHGEYKNGKFLIKDFIKEHNIKDVVFIYEAGSIFFDQYNYGFSKKVIS